MTPPFSHPVRVYWEDTDAGGVVFYANYLKFFERARTEWLRAAGFGQRDLQDRFGVLFVVADTTVRYLAPARLDDELTVTVRADATRGATLVLEQQALHGGNVLAESRISIACVEAGTLKPRRIPTPILEALNG
ncbi:MAG: tol-pal system-associated acyl-CoA thioesterase [Aquincola sp.]|nr:tol-pal system-associated acyl-CoA thioesterase [Aquincola sp.]MDH5329285.1 tol-pal system-associated acyl-CoA thioesterase [Aquincola sp.]